MKLTKKILAGLKDDGMTPAQIAKIDVEHCGELWDHPVPSGGLRCTVCGAEMDEPAP
jgi:hypothetical protein